MTGTAFWPSGEKYVGEFKDNKMHGEGKYYYPSGAMYEGQFRYDKFNGIGIFHYPDGKSTYTGRYTDDHRDGKGVFYNGKKNQS